jgi:crossover junction endodeoxyribonuclease RuvC
VAASSLRILGIDPGLNRTGYGVIDVARGQAQWIASGVIRVPAGELPARLAFILSALSDVIRAHAPHTAAVEQVFVNVNPKATLLLGQARGAAICAAVGAGLTVHEYTALQVKQAVVGYGKAAKPQVQAMVARLLSLDGKPVSDAADALACALTHAHTNPLRAQIAARAGAAPRRRSSGAARSRSAWTAHLADTLK